MMPSLYLLSLLSLSSVLSLIGFSAAQIPELGPFQIAVADDFQTHTPHGRVGALDDRLDDAAFPHVVGAGDEAGPFRQLQNALQLERHGLCDRRYPGEAERRRQGAGLHGSLPLAADQDVESGKPNLALRRAVPQVLDLPVDLSIDGDARIGRQEVTQSLRLPQRPPPEVVVRLLLPLGAGAAEETAIFEVGEAAVRAVDLLADEHGFTGNEDGGVATQALDVERRPVAGRGLDRLSTGADRQRRIVVRHPQQPGHVVADARAFGGGNQQPHADDAAQPPDLDPAVAVEEGEFGRVGNDGIRRNVRAQLAADPVRRADADGVAVEDADDRERIRVGMGLQVNGDDFHSVRAVQDRLQSQAAPTPSSPSTEGTRPGSAMRSNPNPIPAKPFIRPGESMLARVPQSQPSRSRLARTISRTRWTSAASPALGTGSWTWRRKSRLPRSPWQRQWFWPGPRCRVRRTACSISSRKAARSSSLRAWAKASSRVRPTPGAP